MTVMKLLMPSGKCQPGVPRQRAALPQCVHAPDREHNKVAAGCAPPASPHTYVLADAGLAKHWGSKSQSPPAAPAQPQGMQPVLHLGSQAGHHN
jgi:hypothetical protein